MPYYVYIQCCNDVQSPSLSLSLSLCLCLCLSLSHYYIYCPLQNQTQASFSKKKNTPSLLFSCPQRKIPAMHFWHVYIFNRPRRDKYAGMCRSVEVCVCVTRADVFPVQSFSVYLCVFLLVHMQYVCKVCVCPPAMQSDEVCVPSF